MVDPNKAADEADYDVSTSKTLLLGVNTKQRRQGIAQMLAFVDEKGAERESGLRIIMSESGIVDDHEQRQLGEPKVDSNGLETTRLEVTIDGQKIGVWYDERLLDDNGDEIGGHFQRSFVPEPGVSVIHEEEVKREMREQARNSKYVDALNEYYSLLKQLRNVVEEREVDFTINESILADIEDASKTEADEMMSSVFKGITDIAEECRHSLTKFPGSSIAYNIENLEDLKMVLKKVLDFLESLEESLQIDNTEIDLKNAQEEVDWLISRVTRVIGACEDMLQNSRG